MERLIQVNKIMNQRVNDPPGLEKGDPNKTWLYEKIGIIVLEKVEEFFKRAKKSYDTKPLDFNQLDFPINQLMFSFSQFKLAKNFNDQDEYKELKILFHVVHGKSKETFWFFVKIVIVISIIPDV